MASLTTIVVTKNDQVRLLRTLQSIREQLPPALYRWEVLIADGGDPKAVAGPIADAIRESPNVRHVFQTDSGIYDAMNRAAAKVRTSHFHFLNSGDSFASPTAVFEITATVHETDRWAVMDVYHEQRGLALSLGPLSVWDLVIWDKPYCHQGQVVATSEFRSETVFDTSLTLCADYLQTLRLACQGAPRVLGKVLINYEGGGISEIRHSEIRAQQIRAVTTALLPQSQGGVRLGKPSRFVLRLWICARSIQQRWHLA